MRAEEPPHVRAPPSSNPLFREAPALRGVVAGLATTPARSVQALEFMRHEIRHHDLPAARPDTRQLLRCAIEILCSFRLFFPAKPGSKPGCVENGELLGHSPS
jgi:hypothetical protein